MQSFFHKIKKLDIGWNDVPLDDDTFHRLCVKHKIQVRYLRIGVHGFYTCANGRHCIAIDQRLSRFESAFVMFHEFAHFLMHSPRADATMSFCDPGSRLSRDEQEADAFAYCVLLPLELLKARDCEEVADLYGNRFFMEAWRYMSGMESEDLITDEKIERLRAIFDPDRKLETDEDLMELAKYVEDESDETDNWVDHDYDFGVGS